MIVVDFAMQEPRELAVVVLIRFDQNKRVSAPGAPFANME